MKISYSQYSKWANCAMAWKLHYVDGHKFDDQSIHLIFGTAMHETIQLWLTETFHKSEVIAKGMDLSGTFKAKLSDLFKTTIKTDLVTGNNIFICDQKTLTEFYTQGVQILEFIQKHRKQVFPTTNVELVGVETELNVEIKPGVIYHGFIDIVTRNRNTGKVTIYDLKTSGRGWTQQQKSDPIKLQQILLYKKFYAEQMGISEDLVTVEFVILKRTIFEGSMYPIPRVSKFTPSHGKPSINKAWNAVQAFITECFDEKGNHKVDTIKPNPSKQNCKFCVYRDKKNLCPVGIQ